jgi:hypothetical protein
MYPRPMGLVALRKGGRHVEGASDLIWPLTFWSSAYILPLHIQPFVVFSLYFFNSECEFRKHNGFMLFFCATLETVWIAHLFYQLKFFKVKLISTYNLI